MLPEHQAAPAADEEPRTREFVTSHTGRSLLVSTRYSELHETAMGDASAGANSYKWVSEIAC